MPDLNSIMIDLETLSSRPNASILSIGAVVFDENVIDSPESITADRRFYRIVDLEATPSYLHFDIDPAVVYWWLQQNTSAQKHIVPPAIEFDANGQPLPRPSPYTTLRAALLEFRDWYTYNLGGRTYAYGATFDHVILNNAFHALKIKNPIAYKHQLCMRTVISLAQIPCPDLEGLTSHVAIDDCVRQVIWFQNAKRFLLDGGHATKEETQ